MSVALLDTNQSEIQSVVFAQSDIPVNTNNNGGTIMIDIPVDDAINIMVSLYVDFSSNFLTHSSTLSSKLKNTSIVFLCMNLSDQQGKELVFPKHILDEDKCQSMEDLKSILVSETALDHEYFQTNFPMTTNNTTARTSTSATATIIEPELLLLLLLAHCFVNQMIRSIAYAATHLMGYEKVLVLHPGFYFTNSTTQQSLFLLVTKTSKKMTTNSTTTTNINDDQQQQQ